MNPDSKNGLWGLSTVKNNNRFSIRIYVAVVGDK